MTARLFFVTVSAAVLLSLPAAAQSVNVPIDAVSASPDKFKVLLENDHVRVVLYELLPGERDEWHTHPPKVSYVVAGGTLRITTGDGQTFLSEEKAGSTSWMGELGRHFAQNVGSTPVRIVLTEIKGAR